MARPQKQGLDYFPLDVDFFYNEKIEAISGEFGIKGELVTIKLLCAIYRNGYFIVWSELTKMKIARSVPGVSPELLDTIVQRLVKWDFFNKGLFESAHVLSSVSIQNRWKEATRKRLPKDENDLNYWIAGVSGGRNGVSGGRNHAEQEFPAQKCDKVNESKVKESKEEIKKIPTSVGIKESAAASGSTTKADEAFSDSSTQSQKPPAAVPPPGSAAPPSTVIRDAAGIAICQELRRLVGDFHRNRPDLYPAEMYTAFIRYWSEPNTKGTPRWVTEKTTNKGRFDIPGRLATWNKNEQNGNTSRIRPTPSFNRGANPGLRPASLAEPKYQGKGNVREIEDL